MVKTVIQGDVIYTKAHSNSNTLSWNRWNKTEELSSHSDSNHFPGRILRYTFHCRKCLCQYGFYGDSRWTSTKTWMITTLHSIYPNAKGSQWSEQFNPTECSRTSINSANSKQSVLATYKLNTSNCRREFRKNLRLILVTRVTHTWFSLTDFLIRTIFCTNQSQTEPSPRKPAKAIKQVAK